MINMQKPSRLLVLIGLLALIVVLSALGTVKAETVYVSDELVITLRTGKGPGFKIVDYINTGTRLEILKEEDNYLKVSTPEGKEGWVLKRYVSSEPPKAEIIEQLTKKIESMKAAMGNAESILAERDRLLEENKRLKNEKEELEQDLTSLERKDLLYWFLAGAGVLFLGWLIGKSSRQKRFY